MHIWDLENALTSVSEAQKLVKYAGNLTKKDEIELLAERITKRKLTFESYLANKDVKGTETKVENILEKIRVKETAYKVVTNEDKYNTFLAETNSSIPSQATLVAQTSQSKSTSKKENPYEAKVQKSSLQGYMLLLNSFIDGKFESLPLEICEISYLNELTIPYNTLKTLPSEIGKLTELKKLNLNNNKLTSIPAELGNLKNLTVLNIKGNAIPQSEIDHIQKMLPNCKIKF
jgi:Leucine-rich repeat (LRR) protein